MNNSFTYWWKGTLLGILSGFLILLIFSVPFLLFLFHEPIRLLWPFACISSPLAGMVAISFKAPWSHKWGVLLSCLVGGLSGVVINTFHLYQFIENIGGEPHLSALLSTILYGLIVGMVFGFFSGRLTRRFLLPSQLPAYVSYYRPQMGPVKYTLLNSLFGALTFYGLIALSYAFEKYLN